MRRPGPQEGWRSPSDWVRSQSGQWVKAPVQRTRGLNRNSNHTLKRIFKGAATTVIGRRDDDPLGNRRFKRPPGGGGKVGRGVWLSKLSKSRGRGGLP